MFDNNSLVEACLSGSIPVVIVAPHESNHESIIPHPSQSSASTAYLHPHYSRPSNHLFVIPLFLSSSLIPSTFSLASLLLRLPAWLTCRMWCVTAVILTKVRSKYPRLDGLGTEGAEGGRGGVTDGIRASAAVGEGLCAHRGCGCAGEGYLVARKGGGGTTYVRGK